MRLLRRLDFCLLALAVLCVSSAFAQRTSTKSLIVDRIDESQLVPLKGNTHPAAIAQNDRGAVGPNLKMADLILVLKRSPEQQAAFDSLVAAQYDAASPNYHHWLTPAQIGEEFGPALADIATISGWLTGHGFSVDEVSNDRMTIRFSGTAAQVESTFHTEIHNLSVNGEQHIANITDPQIPMALEPAVVGVKALHNFFPRPLHRLGSKVQLNRATGQWERIEDSSTAGKIPHLSSAAVHPEYGINLGSGTSAYVVEDVVPYDFAAIYNVLPLWNATTPIDGTGQTIAVAGTSDINLQDVATFRSTFGLPAGTPPTIIVANGTDPGTCTSTSSTATCTIDDQLENALDVEWSGAVAKGAKIVLVVSGANATTTDTVYSSANYAIQHSLANVLNVSYGECELFLGSAGNSSYTALWQTAYAAGIAVFVASGDSGSPACDQNLGGTAVMYSAEYGLSVSGVASTPYNTAVGGTDFNWGSTASPYWNATNNTTNGSSAKGYIPEIPWNDTCTNPLVVTSIDSQLGQNLTATQVCDDIFTGAISSSTNETGLESLVNVVGGGGGASNCISSNGTTVASCTGGHSKPSWQAGVTGIPTDGERDLPDVSFFASNGFLGSAYLICVSDVGACVTSTPATVTTEPTAQEIGGTSAASPAMAGVMALINQKMGTPQGNPNPEFYKLAGKQTYSTCSSEAGTTSNACYFNDIDTGTNAMVCDYADLSPNCVGTDKIGELSGFSAATGFDLATGLGSLNVANIVNAWTQLTGTATATVTVTPTPAAINVNQSVSVLVAVTGTSGTPSGTVSLSGGGYSAGNGTLANGSYTFTIPADSLANGADTLTASYSGDTIYATATGTGTVTVTKFTPVVTATPSTTSLDSSASMTVTGTVTGSAGTPTGTVTVTGGGYTSSATALSSGSYTVTIPANSLSGGSDSLTVTYSGDPVYLSASAPAINVTVTASVYGMTATTPAAIAPGASATSTITVNSTTGYAGTVTLTCALTQSPNGATDLPTCSVVAGSSTVTLSSGTTSGTGSVSVATTAATTSMLAKPRIGGWAGGAVLAFLVFLGIPARRRGLRAMLGVLVLMFTLGSLAACGGGSSGGGGGGGGGNPGTTAGNYTFTVTGTGNPAVTPAATTTFTVTVN
jgi:subtilase family serine protease